VNSYRDKDKRSFKESVTSSQRELLSNVNVQENILEMKMYVFWLVVLCFLVEAYLSLKTPAAPSSGFPNDRGLVCETKVDR
jgi:hypothetical protein